ncbi:DUF4279 domain-containing protein [Aminobacter sp. P9b]|uniref:DUF4279 domain-containing protein n=1 Tax=Aminobacter sp. P9b TaxID=3133697 RepID=UPI003243F1AE
MRSMSTDGGYVGKIRSQVSLNLRGEDLDPKEITALLGCEPKTSWKKGESVRISEKAKLTKSRVGYWKISVEASDDIDSAIASLFDRLLPNIDWSALADRFAVEVSCGLWLSGYNQGFNLNKETLNFLSQRRISIDFDIYHEELLR